MKVALVNAYYLELYGPINVGRNCYFPLGLGYIAAVLRQGGHNVSLIDPEAKGMSYKELGKEIEDGHYDLIGISCTTSSFESARRIARMVREVSHSQIILGGVHASALPEMILRRFPEFDIVVIGEGEETILELCNSLSLKDPDLSQVRGIAFRQDGQILLTPPRPFIKDLDSLPYPARDLVDLSHYRPHAQLGRGKRSATMISSRGCPYRCTFCASHLTTGFVFRARSPENVVGEIEYLIETYGVEHIIFVDDEFTLNQERVKRICELIIDRGIKVDWFCFTRVDTLSKELLSLMKEAGCFCLCFGIESADEEILKRLKKQITVEQCRRALNWCNELGFKTHTSFILGNPGDSKESIEATINLALELKSTMAFFNIMTPFPGTEIFNQYSTKFEQMDNWNDFVAIGVNPALDLIEVTKRHLRWYMYLAHLKFYGRPIQWFRMARHIKSLRELMVYLRGGLGLVRQMINWRKGSRE